MFSVWQSVKVTNPSHARLDTAGIVFAIHPEHPDEVAVRFDLDQAIELVLISDLVAL